jgi:hypothetical protein
MHNVFRTTPIADELDLADTTRYLDVEPAQVNLPWAGGPAWPLFRDVERTLEAIRLTYPLEVEVPPLRPGGPRRGAGAGLSQPATRPPACWPRWGDGGPRPHDAAAADERAAVLRCSSLPCRRGAGHRRQAGGGSGPVGAHRPRAISYAAST